MDGPRPWHVGLREQDIPPGRVDAHTNDVAVLLWVRNGAITASAAGDQWRISAGSALWVPAGIRHAFRTERGTVVVPAPAHVSGGRAPLSQVHIVDVPPAWGDWLIHRRDFVDHTGNGPLLQLATGSSRRTGSPARLRRPPMPRSPEAHAVAQALLRAPGSALELEELAAGRNVSARTLQRQFTRETGVSFSQWRTWVRVTAAAARIATGHSVGSTRRHVGYSTSAGFTSAFRRHIGLSPSDYAGHARASPPPAPDVAALVAGGEQSPPPIPPWRRPVQVEDCHTLLWVYRGAATIRIGTRDVRLTRGAAVWVPAGVGYRVDLPAGSVLRPLGDRYGRVRVGVDELRVLAFPPEAETYLLHVSIAEYGLLRPDTPPTLADELFREQFLRAAAGDHELTGAIGAIATALWRDPADSRSLADWAAALGTTTAALRREFAGQTGTSLPRWRSHLRMDIARELLCLGRRSGDIARKLGYAGPATFTRAFTAAHGVPPRDYLRTESGRADP